MSCEAQENEVKVETTNVITHTEGTLTYDVIEKPEEANSERMANMYASIHGTEYPRMILKLIDKEAETFEYIEYQLKEDFSWERKKASWSDEIAKEAPGGIGVMVSDSDGELYASAFDKENNYVIWNLQENGKVRTLDMKSVLALHGQEVPSTFDMINDQELAFFFPANSQEVSSKCDVLIYDLIKEQVKEQGSTVSDDVVFDKEGNYYTVSSAQQLIQKYSIHDSLPNKVIQCKGINSVTNNFDMLIDDDSGYIKTGKGIYGGKLDVDKWDVVIPLKSMYYNKENVTFQLQPLSAFSSFLKVPGNSEEFFVKTLCNEETMDFDWVHYCCD